jgi:hypothetical protein
MSTNVLATSSIVAKTALAVLENQLSFARAVNRDYEDEFTDNMARGYAPGQTINIKKPPRYSVRKGRVAVPQATVEQTVPLTLAQEGCDIQFTAAERTLSLTRLEDKIWAAMAPVANEIDRVGLELARLTTFNAVGTVGTLPNTQATAIATFANANQKLDEMAAPRDGRRAFIGNPAMNGALLQGFAGLFNNGKQIDKQFDTGLIDTPYGLGFGLDQNVPTHVNGTQPTTGGTVNGAGQTGSTITVNGGTITGTITAGSVITFGGVFAVNPQNRQSTGSLAQFVVTANVLAGATSIPISPAIVPSGNFQNVTASPANGAAITVLGAASASYASNIAFHKDAFTLAMVPMWAPPSGRDNISVSQKTHKGFTIKVTDLYDGINDVSFMRLDVLYGYAATYPELATKVVA